MLKKYRISIISVSLLIFSFCANGFAKENAISIGGKAGWPDFSYEKGITLGTGRFGYECVELATDERRVTSDTDLLLSFEEVVFKDKSENYEVTESVLLSSDNAKMGKKSALSRGMEGGIKLRGKNGTLFGTGGRTGSFTIEFWLFPALCENGETLFKWRSSKIIKYSPALQLITASFVSNSIQWKFSNFFFDTNFDSQEIVLSSYNKIIPNKWTHHVLTYDEESGLLEYKIDGMVEAIKYVTKSGMEGDEILSPEIGVTTDIEIAPYFTGCIDDFRILKSISSYENRYHTYNRVGGRFETLPLLTTTIGAKFTKLCAVMNLPPQTDVKFYVRAGDNTFNWTENYPAWKPIKLNEKITGVEGLYLQVACDVYTDGLGASTPQITEIICHYQEKRLPVPPYAIFATAYDSAVELSWSPSADGSARGYYVYYGESSGEYLGNIAVEGSSPIDVKKTVSTRITGLENGKIYYFAVAAYSEEGANGIGALSKEVYARPTRGLYNER